MLLFNHKIYSAMLSGSSFDYSPPETWELLGSATDLCVQIRAAQANETFDIKTDFEHSADGLVWEATGNSDAFTVDDSQVFSRFISWDASRLVQAPRYRRLRIWLVGVVSTEAVHLEIWAAGRGKAAQAPTAKGRPASGVFALATSFLKNVAARPRCGRNAECGCGGKDGPCACGNASKDAPPLDLSGAVSDWDYPDFAGAVLQNLELATAPILSRVPRSTLLSPRPPLFKIPRRTPRCVEWAYEERPITDPNIFVALAEAYADTQLELGPPDSRRGFEYMQDRETAWAQAFLRHAQPRLRSLGLPDQTTPISCAIEYTRGPFTVYATREECRRGPPPGRDADFCDRYDWTHSAWPRWEGNFVGMAGFTRLEPIPCRTGRCIRYDSGGPS